MAERLESVNSLAATIQLQSSPSVGITTVASKTYGAVESFDGLDGRLVVLEVNETESAALAFVALLLRVFTLEHLHLATGTCIHNINKEMRQA